MKQPAPVYVDLVQLAAALVRRAHARVPYVDICFWFYNTDVMLTHTGGGPRPKALVDQDGAPLLQFMKTGDPNGGGLVPWPRYTTAKGET